MEYWIAYMVTAQIMGAGIFVYLCVSSYREIARMRRIDEQMATQVLPAVLNRRGRA